MISSIEQEIDDDLQDSVLRDTCERIGVYSRRICSDMRQNEVNE